MKKLRKLPLAAIFTCLSVTCAYSTTLNDLTTPKPLMGRLGIGSQLESTDFTLTPISNKVEAKNKYSEAQKASAKPSLDKTARKTKTLQKSALMETKESGETKKTEVKEAEKNIADPVVKNKLLPVIPNKKAQEQSEKAQDETITQKPEEETAEAKVENTAENANENNIETAENDETTKNTENIASQTSVSYADLSLKKIAQDVSYELDLDETKTASDLAILWAAATERSETMKYTIYKLSNPDEDKPNESTIKKILKPIANFSTLAGASVAGDPYMATGALIGGGLVNAFMKDDKEYNYKFSKVSDADMVLLVRKIDDLQKKLLNLYADYKTKEQLVQMTKENFEKREEIYNTSQGKSKEELIIADVYYKNAKTSAQRAQDDFLTSRAILENLVGAQALEEIEKNN